MPARILLDDEAGRLAAAEALQAGELVAFPTDTVYGLAVALDAPDGLRRLFEAKERPIDRAVVLLVTDLEQARSVGAIGPAALALATACWPGGLTLILPQLPGANLPADLTAGVPTVGVRMPDHDAPRALARVIGPLPTTSANLSGRVEARDAAGVVAQLGDRIGLVLDGGTVRGGVPSTVVDCSLSEPELLRRGAVDAARLATALDAAGITHRIELVTREPRVGRQ